MSKSNIVFETIEKIRESNLTIEQVMGISVGNWVRQKSEDKLRIHFYEIEDGDLVIDVGSYDGVWIEKFLDHHKACKAVCYEPSNKFYELSLFNLTGFEDRVTINNFGLSDSEYQSTIDDTLGLAASVGTGDEKIQVKYIVDELSKFERIKLLKLNIEGGEYKCLPALINAGLIERVENIQVQFHPYGTKDETLNAYHDVVKSLSATHEVEYFFPFIWENWKLK